MTNFTDDDLDARVADLPRDITPAADLWPALHAALPPRRAAGTQPRRWLQMAAAVALFGAGLLAGRYSSAPADVTVDTSRAGMAAAAEVQRAGAAYVKALADLRASKDALPSIVVSQGRGAAIATMEGASWELKQLGPADETARGIFVLASLDREEK